MILLVVVVVLSHPRFFSVLFVAWIALTTEHGMLSSIVYPPSLCICMNACVCVCLFRVRPQANCGNTNVLGEWPTEAGERSAAIKFRSIVWHQNEYWLKWLPIGKWATILSTGNLMCEGNEHDRCAFHTHIRRNIVKFNLTNIRCTSILIEE